MVRICTNLDGEIFIISLQKAQNSSNHEILVLKGSFDNVLVFGSLFLIMKLNYYHFLSFFFVF